MLAVIKVLSYIILFVPSFFRENAVKTVFRPVKSGSCLKVKVVYDRENQGKRSG